MDISNNTILIVKIFLSLIIYFSFIPISFYSIERFKMSRKRYRRNIKKNNEEELNLKQKIAYWKKFGMSQFSKKNLIRFIYISSFLIPIIIIYFYWSWGILASFISPILFIVINKSIISKELEFQQNFLTRMIDFKRSQMGLVDKKATIYNYSKDFEILEWTEDKRRPQKLRIFLPVTFDPIRQDEFLDAFSIRFGGGRPYELDMTDKDYPGLDIDNGVETVTLEKALPNKADWEEWYITHPDVQWSFFPLGLGSKGGIPIKNPETGEVVRLIGYDMDGAQEKYCKKNGIEIGSDIIAAPHSLGAGVTGGGKSVSQNNIINACLMRPKDWILFGIDMKKVELGKLRQHGVPVATTYQDAATLATFVQKIMIDRFEIMEAKGINSWEDMPEDERGPAIMLMVDEVSELLAPVKGKSDEAKEIQEAQELVSSALESIARLGRAARVVQTIWGQRPDSTVVSMQIRQNSPVRLSAGNLPSTISQMIYESTVGARVPGNPKGRMMIKIHSSKPNMFQGFFANSKWIVNYLNKTYGDIVVYKEETNETIGNYNNAKEADFEDYEQEMSMSDFDLIEHSR